MTPMTAGDTTEKADPINAWVQGAMPTRRGRAGAVRPSGGGLAFSGVGRTVESVPTFGDALAGIAPDALERLLDCLRAGGGFDFADYHRPCLARRVAERMRRVGVSDVGAYTEFLRHYPGEGEALCQTIWINVTDFFRDPPVWASLRDRALPALLARKGPAAPLRVWSAGCASGQEAYSIAALLADILGLDGLNGRVEIVATDVDAEALAFGKRGVYPDRAMAAVPPSLREQCFAPVDGGRQVREELRRVVRFRRQNLLRDRPAGTFDLIVCRNALIYFRPKAQGRVLARLRRGLSDDGYLLLGRGECPVFHNLAHPGGEGFTPVDLGTRLYRPTRS